MYRGLKAARLAGSAAGAARPVPASGTAEGNAKVNRICAAVRAAIEARPDGPARWRRTLLTTYVCERPPNLEAALLLVKPLPRTPADTHSSGTTMHRFSAKHAWRRRPHARFSVVWQRRKRRMRSSIWAT